MKFILIITLILSTYSINVNAQSDEYLSELALFHRCYSAITGKRASLSHPSVVKIRTSSAKGIDECMSIFNKAMLNSSGRVSDLNDGQDVINHFYQYFRSWFSEKSNTGIGSTNFVDGAEPALHFTRAMFKPSTPFHEVVTGKQNIMAIRSDGNGQVNLDERYSGDIEVYTPGMIQNGFLQGITTPYIQSGFSGNINKTFFLPGGKIQDTMQSKWGSFDCARSNGQTRDQAIADGKTCETRRNYGGGLIGSLSFLGNYTYVNVGTSADGGEKTHRLWSKEILETLLCREAPYARGIDVAPFVVDYNNKYPGSHDYKLPFRGDGICMGCHSSMDFLAATARKFVPMSSSIFSTYEISRVKNGTLRTETHSFSLPFSSSKFDQEEDVPLHLVHNDSSAPGYVSNFWRRPANGKLFYRTYNGGLVNYSITDPQVIDGFTVYDEVGKALANLSNETSDDLYVCSAKRMFSFFTGIDVSLADPYGKTFSEADIHYKSIIEKLGNSLKSHQDLRQLVIEIINLDLFKRKSLRDTTSKESI